MKTFFVYLLLFLAITGYPQKKESLFNGKNLKGWIIYVKDQAVKPGNLFYMKDGVIETPGNPAGYIRTRKVYSNYKLHAEIRFPEKAGNSGVMIHTNLPDEIWPAHFQCQLKHQHVGDFIVMGVGLKATVAGKEYVSTEKERPVVPMFGESSEKPIGEWNSCDIACTGNSIEIRINGVLQSKATNCSLTSGTIGFQSEQGKIQFRNIWIEKI
jgi:hypothetical protein